MLRDKRVWLGVATVVVLLVAWRVLMPAAAPCAAPRRRRARARARALADAEPARAASGEARRVDREPRAAQRGEAQPVPLSAAAAAAAAAEADVHRRRRRRSPRARPLPVVPPGPPPPPPIPLKFIGVVERANGVKWAVLSDGKSAPQHGKEGDVIDGRYRIVKIGTESVELTYVDGRGRQTVRLTGQ